MSFRSWRLILAISLLNLPAAVAGTRENIEFSQAAGAPLYLDAGIPDGPGPFPAAIIVHGGGCVRGDRRVDVRPLFAPLNKAGIAWFSIDYRLSSDLGLFGVAVDDVRSAIRFVRSHAGDYGIDPERIALVGESAGGHLAAMAALTPQPGEDVKAVVAMYAPMNLVDLARNSAFVPKQIRDSLHGSPFEKMILARLKQLSPLENVGTTAPPFLLIHGTADNLVPFAQSEAMCDRLRAAGSNCELYPVAGGGHGMRWWASSAYAGRMVQWLTRELALPDRP